MVSPDMTAAGGRFNVDGPDAKMLQRAIEDHEARVHAVEEGVPVPATAGVVEALKAVVAGAGGAVSGLVLPVVARTATADGTGTGTIAAAGTLQFVQVTTDSADKIIVLPPPVVGTIVILNNGATGYELRSSAPATVAINGGAESAAESAIAANSTVIAICITTTAWKAIFLDADGDVAKVEAAAAGA